MMKALKSRIKFLFCGVKPGMISPLEKQEEFREVLDEEQPYRIVGFLGEGASGGVAICYSTAIPYKDRVEYAAKVCSLHLRRARTRNREEEIEYLKTEVRLLKECAASCDFVVGFIDAYIFRTVFVIVTELAIPGSLSPVLKQVEVLGEELRSLLYCVVSAIEHIHSLGIVHGDVKPSNLLISDKGIVKICDFGSAWRVEDQIFSSEIGSLRYAAPEILPRFYDKVEVPFNPKQDIWAIGMVALDAYYGPHLPAHLAKPKGKDSESKAIKWQNTVTDSKFGFDLTNSVDPDLVTFVNWCLTNDHNQRPTAKSLVESNYIRQNETKWQYRGVLKHFAGKAKVASEAQKKAEKEKEILGSNESDADSEDGNDGDAEDDNDGGAEDDNDGDAEDDNDGDAEDDNDGDAEDDNYGDAEDDSGAEDNSGSGHIGS